MTVFSLYFELSFLLPCARKSEIIFSNDKKNRPLGGFFYLKSSVKLKLAGSEGLTPCRSLLLRGRTTFLIREFEFQRPTIVQNAYLMQYSKLAESEGLTP